MTHDDELRRRMNRMADEADLGTVTLESVEARGRQRTQRQRIFAVAAAFLFVAGAAFGLNALTDQQGETDVASPLSDDAEASTAEGDEGGADDGATEDEGADAEAVTTTTIPGDAVMTEVARGDFAFDQGAYYGGNQVVAWKDGFLAWGQRFVPSEVSMSDLIPDISERFPAEIIDAMRAAGIEEGDPYTIEDATEIIMEAGLFDLAQETVLNDPELLDAYNQASRGGDYVPFVELSTDGVNWEPVDVDLLLGENGWPQLSSNGDALVLVVQNNEWDPETGRSLDQSITVHITTDLETWHTHELDIDVPDVSPYAQVDAYPSSVAAGPDSWYVSIGVHTWVDVYSALPADVVDDLQTNNWGYETREEGIALVSYPDEPAEYLEPEDDWTDEDWAAFEEQWQPTVERIIPWSELPFNEQDMYGPGPEGGLSFAYTGDYAGNIQMAGAPPVETFECCQVTASEAGFLTLVWEWQDYDYGYDYPVVGAEVDLTYPTTGGDDIAPDEGDDYFYDGPNVSLWFSTDGQIWSKRELPDVHWYDNVVAVDGGVLLLGSNETGQSVWLGSPDGRDFEPVDGPEIPEHHYLYFNNSGGQNGVVSLMDVAEYEYYDFVAYSTDFSVDGIDISLSVSDTGEQRLVVSQDGEVLVDRTAQLWMEEVWNHGEDGFEVHDDDGNVIVAIPWETVEQEIFEAESRAWERRDIENPYVPDFVLIASVDGRTWFQLDLPDEEGAWYEVAAISNGIVTVRTADQWTAYSIG